MKELITFSANLKHLKTFPCKKNSKIPATVNGYKDAKFEQDVLELKEKGYNVGLACKDSGLIVLDADYDETRSLYGVKTLGYMCNILGELPYTLIQKTPRGGYHFIYLDEGIIKPIGKIGKDVDVKYNGYIMCYPSDINGRAYEFIEGFDDKKFYLSTLPQPWIDYLNGKSVNFSNSKNQNKKTIYKNVEINKMFNECLFLQFCKDNAENLGEPMWHSMISVLAQIENSDSLIHELSKPYPAYRYEETQNKINYARKFGYAQTCKYISANYPDVCRNCKYINA